MAEYLASSDQSMRRRQEQLVTAGFAELRNVSGFEDLRLHVECVVDAMKAAGFEVQLLDEDGESTLVYGAAVAVGRSITIEIHWDDYEGPSVAFTFREPTLQLILAASRATGMVEVKGS